MSQGDVSNLTALRNIEGILIAEKHYNNGEDYAIQRFIAGVKSMMKDL
ncbi:MAG: hypothetical protein AAB317_04310 [Nitrospirota bacterium]